MNTVGRRDVGGVRARLQPRARRRAPDPRHVDVAGRRAPRCRSVTSGEGVPTSRDPASPEDRVTMETDVAAARSRRRRPRRRSGRAPRAASCSCRRARRAACGACRRGRCARAAGRSTSRWEPTSGRGRVWSFIVPHPPLLPAFAEVAPYNAIIVELEEDPTIRFVGNLVASADGAINEIDPATITIGEPVTSCSTASTTCPSRVDPRLTGVRRAQIGGDLVADAVDCALADVAGPVHDGDRVSDEHIARRFVGRPGMRMRRSPAFRVAQLGSELHERGGARCAGAPSGTAPAPLPSRGGGRSRSTPSPWRRSARRPGSSASSSLSSHFTT